MMKYPSAPRRFRVLIVALTAATLAAACATNGDASKAQSAGVGAAIGCVGGALLAKLAREKPGAGCAVGAVAGGIVGYQKARSDELRRAREAAAAIPVLAGAAPATVQTQAVVVTDAKSGKAETVETFKALSMDVPVSQLESPDGKDVMRKLSEYARKVADDRAESVNLDVARTATLAKPDAPKRVVLESASERVGKGSLVRRRLADVAVPARIQRVTVEATNAERVTL